MRKGKYEAKGRHCCSAFGSKSLALVLACVLLVGGVIGGTVAWLTTKTTTVENVFTTSDINVKLEEDEKQFKMIPGWTIDKSPRVTVEKDSEDCWLFVEVTESTNLELSKYIKYAVNTTTTVTVTDGVSHGGWIQGTGTDGVPTNVYYRKVTGVTSDQVFAVLGGGTYPNTEDTTDVEYTWANDEVLTLPDVTKEMMAAVTTGEAGNQPKLSFTAYASQLMKNNTTEFTAAQAWNNVKPTTTTQ